MSNLSDEVENGRRDSDHFIVHHFEKFLHDKTGFLNEVYRVGFCLTILVFLLIKEVLHVDVVILAEELEETENTTESFFTVVLLAQFGFVPLSGTEIPHNSIVICRVVVVCVSNVIVEMSLPSEILVHPQTYQVFRDCLNKLFHLNQHFVLGIFLY